jgi:hypothetical protein
MVLTIRISVDSGWTKTGPRWKLKKKKLTKIKRHVAAVAYESICVQLRVHLARRIWEEGMCRCSIRSCTEDPIGNPWCRQNPAAPRSGKAGSSTWNHACTVAHKESSSSCTVRTVACPCPPRCCTIDYCAWKAVGAWKREKKRTRRRKKWRLRRRKMWRWRGQERLGHET